jgi:hypothetical protein
MEQSYDRTAKPTERCREQNNNPEDPIKTKNTVKTEKTAVLLVRREDCICLKNILIGGVQTSRTLRLTLAICLSQL